VSCKAVSSLTISGNGGDLTCKATIEEITPGRRHAVVDGNATLELAMTGQQADGAHGTLGIQVLGGGGGLWFSSNWDGARTVEQPVAHGKVDVRE
jgi:hypothetical protein